jgi:hypothetical protein
MLRKTDCVMSPVADLAAAYYERWGRLAGRDICLKRDVAWRVEARLGNGDAPVWSDGYPTEARPEQQYSP